MEEIDDMRWFTRDNTEGYSDRDIEVMNRMYDHRLAPLVAAERPVTESLLQYTREQVLIDYDLAQPRIPRVIRAGTDRLRVTKILDVRLRIVSVEPGSVSLVVLVLADLDDGDLPGVLMVIYPDGEIITQRDPQSPTSAIPDDLSEIDWPSVVVVCGDGLPRYLPGFGNVWKMEGKKVVWELIRNGKEIIATLEQDTEDLRVNGRGYVLDALIPEEHAEQAFWCGEWDEEGYNYHLDNGDTYLVRYYPVPEETEE